MCFEFDTPGLGQRCNTGHRSDTSAPKVCVKGGKALLPNENSLLNPFITMGKILQAPIKQVIESLPAGQVATPRIPLIKSTKKP